jgi:ABC-2 type transport system permease protein
MKSGSLVPCLKMTWVEAKLFLREPVSAFFSLVFPLMMLFLFGSIVYGNHAIPGAGPQGSIDTAVPVLAAMVIGTTGLMSTTITLATYRENGILRRLRTTPVSPLIVLAAQVLVVFCMTSLGVLLLVIVGKWVYHVRFEGHVLSVLAGFVLASLSFFGIGFILAGTMPNARTAQIVGLVLLYPMVYLSGAAGFPRELLPTALQKVSAFLPLTYVVNLLRGLWTGEPWSQHATDAIVLAGILVAGVLISIKTFRWE